MGYTDKELSTLARNLEPYWRMMFAEHIGGYLGADGVSVIINQQEGNPTMNSIQGTVFNPNDVFGRGRYCVDLMIDGSADYYSAGSGVILAGRYNLSHANDDTVCIGGLGAKTWSDYESGMIMGNRISASGDCQTLTLLQPGYASGYGFSAWYEIWDLDLDELNMILHGTSWIAVAKAGMEVECAYKIDFAVKNDGGVPSILYQNKTDLYESDANWDVRVAVHATRDELEWEIYGTAEETLRMTIITQVNSLVWN